MITHRRGRRRGRVDPRRRCSPTAAVASVLAAGDSPNDAHTRPLSVLAACDHLPPRPRWLSPPVVTHRRGRVSPRRRCSLTAAAASILAAGAHPPPRSRRSSPPVITHRRGRVGPRGRCSPTAAVASVLAVGDHPPPRSRRSSRPVITHRLGRVGPRRRLLPTAAVPSVIAASDQLPPRLKIVCLDVKIVINLYIIGRCQ